MIQQDKRIDELMEMPKIKLIEIIMGYEVNAKSEMGEKQ
jgi:hypothetical protein